MTRSEKREQSNQKRKAYCAWMLDILESRFKQTNNWDDSVDWMGKRIEDKIKEIPQEKELILEAVKLVKESFSEVIK